MEEEAMRLGAVAYLRKPFDKKPLLDAMRFDRWKRVGLNSGKKVMLFE